MTEINNIPKRFEEGFKLLGELTDDQFNIIKESISLSSLVSSMDTLIEKIHEKDGLTHEMVSVIFNSIASLIPILEDEKLIPKFAEDIANISFEKKIVSNLFEFKERLLFLLSSKQIFHAAKAADLLTEFSNVYIGAKIATDIRPVFDIDVKKTPIGGIVVHNLHIHYRADEEGDHRDIYLALDTNDIRELQRILERAINKEKAIEGIFEKAGIANLNE